MLDSALTSLAYRRKCRANFPLLKMPCSRLNTWLFHYKPPLQLQVAIDLLACILYRLWAQKKVEQITNASFNNLYLNRCIPATLRQPRPSCCCCVSTRWCFRRHHYNPSYRPSKFHYAATPNMWIKWDHQGHMDGNIGKKLQNSTDEEC